MHIQGVKSHSDGTGSFVMNNPWRSQLVLQNSDLNLDRDFSFTAGQLYIQGDVVITGTNQFNYTSTHAAFIDKDSTLKIDMNTTFSYGPIGSIDRTLIKMDDVTSQIFLNGCTLKSSTTGMQLTKGTLVIDHKNYISNSATGITEAIAFGDGVNDLNVEIMPGGSIEVASGQLDYMNVS